MLKTLRYRIGLFLDPKLASKALNRTTVRRIEELARVVAQCSNQFSNIQNRLASIEIRMAGLEDFTKAPNGRDNDTALRNNS